MLLPPHWTPGAGSARVPRFALVATLTALVLGGAAACGRDASGPSTPAVETIVLGGVPTAALRVGGTAQLSATALSSTGSTINGAAVTWTSSSDAVATVSRGGLVTAHAAGAVTVTASSGSGSATAEILVVAPLVLTPGSTAALPDGSVSLSVVGGWTGSLTLLVGPGAASLADDKVVPGTIFQIGSESGSTFINGVTLTLRYDPARLPPGVTADGLQLYHRTPLGWVAIRRSASNPTERVVTGSFAAAGTYAVRFTPVDRVILSGGQVDGALYVGQSARLGAVAVSAIGDTLVSRTITWRTSAPGIAAVDAEGTVTAASPGTAMITASADATSATTQLHVLVRPIASWIGALDWMTYRGNNRRTGFVDATLDPVVFTRRWEVTLSTTNGTLNEPATGYGNVYVSSNSYFGAQALWALDATTGVTRWTRALGEIHSVNGPATGNGRVYVSTGGHEDSFLWSFDAADGTVMFRSSYGNQWSRWQAPAVTAGIVFLGGGYYGGMSAFAALDGALLWRRDLPQEDGWTPAADAGKTYVFGNLGSSSGLLTLDGPTGTATLGVPNLGLPTSGTPVIGGANDIYAVRNSRLLAIDLLRNVVAWDLPGAYEGVPALDEANVYAVINGQVEARRRSDGARVWTWVPQPGTVAKGSVIVTRNLLFVRLALSGGPSSGRVAALDLAARKVVWSYDADGGDIALGNGLLVVTSRTGAKVTAIAVR